MAARPRALTQLPRVARPWHLLLRLPRRLPRSATRPKAAPGGLGEPPQLTTDALPDATDDAEHFTHALTLEGAFDEGRDAIPPTDVLRYEPDDRVRARLDTLYRSALCDTLLPVTPKADTPSSALPDR